ncbi:hypothetical protein HK102_009211, partial [Quaeritorhiza haematococci]
MTRGSKILVVTGLPGGKDRSDLLSYVRSHYEEGFGRIIYISEGRCLLVYSDAERATEVLENIRKTTVIQVNFPKDDNEYADAHHPKSPRDLGNPSPVLRLVPHCTPLTRTELAKVMRCYHGFEDFEVLESPSDTAEDFDDGDGASKRQQRQQKRPDVAPYVFFRDVFCAEKALDDLLERTNIQATFASDPDGLRRQLSEHQRGGKSPRQNNNRLSTSPTTSAPRPRFDPTTLSWLVVSKIPEDVSYASLRRHFTRLEGFVLLSFHARHSLFAAFTNADAAQSGCEILQRNTKMDVRTAERKEVDSIRVPYFRKPHSNNPASSGVQVLYVRLHHPWMSPPRFVEMLKSYKGFSDSRVGNDHILARFESHEDARAALDDLERTTDLVVDFSYQRGGGGPGGEQNNHQQHRSGRHYRDDEDGGRVRPENGDVRGPRRGISVESSGYRDRDADRERPPRDRERGYRDRGDRDRGRDQRSSYQHDLDRERSGDRDGAPRRRVTVDSTSKERSRDRRSVAGDRSPSRVANHYGPSPTSSSPAATFAVNIPDIMLITGSARLNLREYFGSMDGFEKMAVYDDGFYAWFRTRDLALRAASIVESEFPKLRPSVVEKRPPREQQHRLAPPMSPASHYSNDPPSPQPQPTQNSLFIRNVPGLPRELLQVIIESYPGYTAIRQMRDYVIVDFSDGDKAASAMADIRATTNIRIEYSNRSARGIGPSSPAVGDGDRGGGRPPSRQHQEYGSGDRDRWETSSQISETSVRSETSIRSDRMNGPCRTVYVSNLGAKDKVSIELVGSSGMADVYAAISKLPGFIRVQFGLSNFRVVLSDPDHAREAMGKIRFISRSWKATYARKEPEEKKIEEVGEASKVLWTSTLYWNESELTKFMKTFDGFDRLIYDSAHSWLYFDDQRSANRALEILNRTTNLYSVFSAKKFIDKAEAAAAAAASGGNNASSPSRSMSPSMSPSRGHHPQQIQHPHHHYHQSDSSTHPMNRERGFRGSPMARSTSSNGAETGALRHAWEESGNGGSSPTYGLGINHHLRTGELRGRGYHGNRRSLPPPPSGSDGYRNVHMERIGSAEGRGTRFASASPSRGNAQGSAGVGSAGVGGTDSKHLLDGPDVQKMGSSPGAEHFPTRRVDGKLPTQTCTNVILVRNSGVTKESEIHSIFAKCAGFSKLLIDRKAMLHIYVLFSDVAAAAQAYESYELRETLGKGYGGVSFQYRNKDTAPPEWSEFVEEEIHTLLDEPSPRPAPTPVAPPRAGPPPTSGPPQALPPASLPF